MWDVGPGYLGWEKIEAEDEKGETWTNYETRLNGCIILSVQREGIGCNGITEWRGFLGRPSIMLPITETYDDLEEAKERAFDAACKLVSLLKAQDLKSGHLRHKPIKSVLYEDGTWEEFGWWF